MGDISSLSVAFARSLPRFLLPDLILPSLRRISLDLATATESCIPVEGVN